jgi:hypothetical protein
MGSVSLVDLISCGSEILARGNTATSCVRRFRDRIAAMGKE